MKGVLGTETTTLPFSNFESKLSLAQPAGAGNLADGKSHVIGTL
jgi:hypothetical protein